MVSQSAKETLNLDVGIVGYEQSNYKVLMVVNDKNTIKAGGSTAFEQNVCWMDGWAKF